MTASSHISPDSFPLSATKPQQTKQKKKDVCDICHMTVQHTTIMIYMPTKINVGKSGHR